MQISCAFPTTLDTPRHVELAERLGYARAWLYDTPQQSPDIWMTLALSAQRTSRIGLGPGVLVPSLRHPMVNAAGTATLAALAPGRVAVAFGTGFTGRRAMGYGPLPWAYLAAYVRAYRGLLRGDVVEWEGARMRMLHPAGSGARRPVDVPVLVAALGPRGARVAEELGDGVFVTGKVPPTAAEFAHVALLCWGTVLDEGEDGAGARVRDAAGPGTVLAYHSRWEGGGREAVERMPGGSAWLDVVERVPPEERHLAVHVEHCLGLNEADAAAWDAGGSALAPKVTVTGSAQEVRERLAGFAAAGVTEVVYQPAGSRITRELSAFMQAATG